MVYDRDTADRSKKKYRELKQPPLAPTPYVFGSLWIVLYTFMGYAAHRAWSAGKGSFDLEKVRLAKISLRLEIVLIQEPGQMKLINFLNKSISF